MKKGCQKDKTLVRGKDVYIGIDVHKENWHVAARVSGEEVFHGRMASEYHSLRKLLDRFKGCRIKVAYEAGPFGPTPSEYSSEQHVRQGRVTRKRKSDFPGRHYGCSLQNIIMSRKMVFQTQAGYQ